MEREIKFRGKRLDNGEWVYGDLLHPKTSCRIVNYTNSKDSCDGMIGVDYHYYDVDENTVGQFTGLKDKNGKDIYEWDIVRRNGYNYLVKFLSGMFYASIEECHEGISGGFPLHALTEDESNACEIVGNKFDNPDLLK